MVVEIKLFAQLRELAQASRLTLEVASDATVAVALAELKRRLKLEIAEQNCVFAVNGNYVEKSFRLSAGDELALIPPVSGGAFAPWLVISEKPLDASKFIAFVNDPQCGANAIFIGTTRVTANNGGQEVVSLKYEAYSKMAIQEMHTIAHELHAVRGIRALAAGHRTGVVAVGEPSLVVAISAPHSAAAQSAVAEFVERLKRTVPIWKKECYRDGEDWVVAKPASPTPISKD